MVAVETRFKWVAWSMVVIQRPPILESLQAWQDCIDEVAEAGTDDAPTKCSQQVSLGAMGLQLVRSSVSSLQMDALLTCMMKNKDYYEDQLSAMFSGPGEAKEQEHPDTAAQSSPSPEETPRQKDTSTAQQGIPDADQGQTREPSVVVESSVED